MGNHTATRARGRTNTDRTQSPERLLSAWQEAHARFLAAKDATDAARQAFHRASDADEQAARSKSDDQQRAARSEYARAMTAYDRAFAREAPLRQATLAAQEAYQQAVARAIPTTPKASAVRTGTKPAASRPAQGEGGTKRPGTRAKTSAISLDQRAAVALARVRAGRVREINPPQAAAARWVARWLGAHPLTEPIPPPTPAPAKETARQRTARLYQNWQRPMEWIEATRGIRAADPNAFHRATVAATEQGMAAQREWLAISSLKGSSTRSTRTKKSA